jgi:hypothetical protein
VLPQHHDAIRLWIRQRAEQDGVDYGKDCSVRTDAYGECENGNDGKRSAARESTNRVANVVE